MTMRVAVIGAGAVGSFVGCTLTQTTRVLFVGRERQREQFESGELRAISLDGRQVRARADAIEFATNIAAGAGADAILIAVKSAQTAAVAEELAAAGTGEDTLIVSLQNGVTNAGELRKRFANAVPSIVSFNVITEDEGVVRQTTDGPLVVERSRAPVFDDLATSLDAGNLDLEVQGDIEREQWTKLVINLSNAISALSGAPTPVLLATKGYRRAIAATADEALDVLAAAGIKPAPMRGIPLGLMPKLLRLPTPIVKLIMRSRLRVDPRARSSMWQDLERGRPTEVDFLNGEIVRLAEANGASAPVNSRLVELVHEAEAKAKGPPNLSPDALLAALELQG